MTLLRSFWNRYFGSCDYCIWQCLYAKIGVRGSTTACQRLRGHIGKCRDYHGSRF